MTDNRQMDRGLTLASFFPDQYLFDDLIGHSWKYWKQDETQSGVKKSGNSRNLESKILESRILESWNLESGSWKNAKGAPNASVRNQETQGILSLESGVWT
jgi:hypothetical protein